MRALIFGGRNFNDWNRFMTGIIGIWMHYGPITHVIQGGATGADYFGKYLAEQWGIPQTEFAADWDNITAPGAVVKFTRGGKPYNALAGFWRNDDMITQGRPDFGIRCPGGNGTRDMADRLDRAGILTLSI